MTTQLQPFQVRVPDSTVERIRERLRQAHWAAVPDDDNDWVYGTEARWLKRLIAHWIDAYDWRAAEAGLNRWPQFTVEIEGQRIHFLHIKGSASRARPLLLTHGWPGSVLEFFGCIERLAHPERHGGVAEDGFDLVIPSLPGYGFSSAPPRPIGPRAVARLWRKLMADVLGYARFGAQGGDWGAAVTSWLGAEHGDVTHAIHLNMVPSWALTPGTGGPEENTYNAKVAAMRAQEMGYFMVQSTKPQTIALALGDSPLGFAAWVCEKFRTWGDTRGDIESRFSMDTLITNLMLYLVNDNVGPALWMYRGRAAEALAGPMPRVDRPTGVALFPGELIPYPPRALAEQVYAISRWTQMAAGGHFAALEEPVAFSDDVRVFFADAAL